MKTLLAVVALTFAIPSVSLLSTASQVQAASDLYVVDDSLVNTLIRDGRARWGASGSQFLVGYTFRLGKRSDPSKQVRVTIVERIIDRTTGNPLLILRKV